MIKRIINVIVIVMILSITVGYIHVNASLIEIERSYLDLCDITENERKTIAYGLGLEVLDSKSMRNSDSFVIGFDVSENGELAIAFDNCTIAVMTADHEVYNRMSLPGYGEYFTLDWNGEYIDVVFRGRQNYIVAITPEGEVVDAARYDYTDKTYDYLNELDFNRESIEYNGFEYLVENSSRLAGSKADTLICIDEDGKETVIYKSKESVPSNAKGGLVVFFMIFILVPLFFLFVIFRYKNQNNKDNSRETDDMETDN